MPTGRAIEAILGPMTPEPPLGLSEFLWDHELDLGLGVGTSWDRPGESRS